MDPKKQIKFMTYNVWSREDVVVYKRMQAIGRLVHQNSPDVIFFQEITPYIHRIFQSFAWWKDYHSSPVSPEEQTEKHFCLMLSKLPLENYARWRFSNTATGRGYLEADITPGSASTKPIRIATTQLECPIPRASMYYCTERYVQAEHAVTALSSTENVVFGGDMSWDDAGDMPFPLPAGWVDASQRLRLYRWTYDGFWNGEVGGVNGYVPHTSAQKRSDRLLCKLQDYRLDSISFIGDQDIGLIYKRKHYWCGFPSFLELMPSCHRGLVLTIVPNEPARRS